jgi:hypothetical protein
MALDAATLTVEQAEDLTARTFDAIDARLGDLHPALRHGALNLNADRERIASDLAGLRECWGNLPPDRGPWTHFERHARRYSDGPRRTARLYGVTP